MNGRGAQAWMLALMLGVGAAGCRKDTIKPEVAEEVTAKDQYAIDSARMELDRASVANPSELAGSYWRLVQLRGSHDSVFAPERLSVYTVEFGNDGRANVVGGCNRGGGSYTVTPPRGLAFGPLATTRAMCPPGSLSARYLGDLARVQSYQMVGGHLYMSLADNGGIYEFRPDQEVAIDPNEQVLFACTDTTGARTRIVATFTQKPASVSIMHKGKKVVLPQVQSGSGAKYEGPGGMLWNKGRDATVTWEGTTLNCALSEE